jgi:hypothetical protein
MIDREDAWKFANEWLDAWNKHDIKERLFDGSLLKQRS